MTAVPRKETRMIAESDFVLATDLDGTFLGGTADDRMRLYDWIERERSSIGLIFVTGRDPAFIAELCDGTDVPWPDFVIGDVGTTIAQAVPMAQNERIRPIDELEAEIAGLWNDSGATVRAELDGHPGLTPQPTEFRYRVSYDLDPAAFCHSAIDKVARLGHDHLISANRFFDVLPRGVSKGPSLRRLIHHLGIDEERVLVAGDTLNDWSMINSGLNAVAVGGSEAALIDRIRDTKTVYCAEGIGAAGIIEAIEHFNLSP